jgi:hypothetical protein
MQARSNVTFSIDTAVLEKLNAYYSPSERNKLIEDILISSLPMTESEIAAAALEVETHPDFASVREVSAFADAAAMDMARKHL